MEHIVLRLVFVTKNANDQCKQNEILLCQLMHYQLNAANWKVYILVIGIYRTNHKKALWGLESSPDKP